MDDLKQLFKEENQSTSSSEVLNRDNQALGRNTRNAYSGGVVAQPHPEIDSWTLSESGRVLMSVLSFGLSF